MKAVTAENIRKKYPKVQALDGVSLEVNPGEIFGIIGPDGAGKTTLFRILTTLIFPDEGIITVEGLDVVKDYRSIRERVGYMPGKFSLYLDLTVEENLNFFATVFHTSVEENYELIRDIYQQIEPFKNRRAGALSGGMKQKLALCCALVHKPTVLFLDEPTTGVDPVSRKEFWAMLKQLSQQQITILVSTPYMDEASLCDRIALMKDGRFLVTDSPESIVQQYDGILWAVRSNNSYKLLSDLRKNPSIELCFAFGDYLHATLDKGTSTTMEALESYLHALGHTGVQIKQITPTVEDCFMKLAVDV
jgi:ABC-2 type transport system ATP-binding protein